MTTQADISPESQTKRKPRMRRSREQWQSLILQYENSGLTQESFCNQHRISSGSLHKWRKRLMNTSSTPAFVDITHQLSTVDASIDAQTDSPWQVELELGQGVVLRVRQV